MPSIQTTFGLNIPFGKPGHVPDMMAVDIDSHDVETAAGIAFGAPVAQGAAPRGVIAYAGAVAVMGFAVRDHSVRSPLGTDVYSQYESAAILRKGKIEVTAGATVAAGDPVYVTTAGVLTNSSSGNTLVTGARWETATASGAIGIIYLK